MEQSRVRGPENPPCFQQNMNQGLSQPLQNNPLPSNPPPTELNLEDILRKFMSTSDARLQGLEACQRNKEHPFITWRIKLANWPILFSKGHLELSQET